MQDHNKTPKVKPGTILEPGRVACPYCATVQFVVPNVSPQTCPNCKVPFVIGYTGGAATKVSRQPGKGK